VPNTLADNSFIPFYLRKYYQMPTGGESAEVYAYNFFRLMRRCQDTTLLFCNATEGNNKKSMSRFLMQMLTSPEFVVHKGQLVESANVQMQELELIDPTLLPLSQHQTEIRLSPSSIGTYLECPRQFYLEKVLHLDASEPVCIVMKANEIGTLVHGTLEAVYRQMGEGQKWPFRVAPEALDAYLTDEKRIDSALDKGYEALNTDYLRHHPEAAAPYRREEHQAETLVARTHVKRVLESDKRLAEHGLQIVALEQPWKLQLPVPTDAGSVNVLLNGFIDRLDIVNGQLRIIDYKSGKYDAGTFRIDSLDDLTANEKHKYMLQTFIYCLGVGKKELTLAPGLLFPSKKECDPTLFVGGAPVTDFAVHEQAFRERLTDKVREIISATDFPKCEDGKCPAYCPFLLLCGRKGKSF